MPAFKTVDYGSPAKPKVTRAPSSWSTKHYVLEGPLQVGAAIGSLPFGGFTTLYRDLARVGAPGTIEHIEATRVSPTRGKNRPVVTAHTPRVGIEQNRAKYQGRSPQITGEAPAVHSTGYLYSSASPKVAKAYKENVARTHGMTGTYTGPAAKHHGKIIHLAPPMSRPKLTPHPYYPKGGYGNETHTYFPGGATGASSSGSQVGAPPQSTTAPDTSGGGIDLGKLVEVAAIAVVAIVLLVVVAKRKKRR